jgi:hypothetical protein
VVGIVSPLLKEQGGHTFHSLLTRISNAIAEPGEDLSHEGMFRTIYNGLKHAGNKRIAIAASDDLTITADLKAEAAHMLDAAKQDFRQIKLILKIRDDMPPEFVRLLETEGSYA